MLSMKVGTVQSSFGVDTAWDAAWLSLATAAALTLGGVGGAPQSSLVPQPLHGPPEGGEDTGGVSNPIRVLSDSCLSSQACATLSSVHGNSSD